MATGSSFIALLLGTFLAYSISRFNVGGNNFRYMVLTIRMVPPMVIAIPILMYYAIVIPYTTQVLFNVRISLFDTYSGLAMLYSPQAAIGTVITVPALIPGMFIQKHLIKGFSLGMLRK